MREIKFRAWDKDEKCMHEFGLMDIADCYIIGTGKQFAQLSVVMQFTGLKDKNGKEIYEGDIVVGSLRNDFGSLQKDVVGTIFWNDTSAGFATKLPTGRLIYFIGKKVEVIGNIYQHPHLLTA